MVTPLARESLPHLAVGCMNFGQRTPEKESVRIIGRALERSLSWFDTANVYNDGESERIVGRALSRDREQCIVATKVGLARSAGKPEGLSPSRMMAALDESLERLGMPYVDVYYLHAPDRSTPLAETLSALADILRVGKARAWGMSNFASWQVLDAMNLADARGMARPIVAQQMYNAVIRQLDLEWFGFTRARPIHTTVYNPLAGGLLTGKHTRSAPPPKGSRFDGNRMYQRRYWSERMFDVADALAAVAKDESTSLVELAYAFCAQRPGIDSVLLGPATTEQLDVGIDACQRPALSDKARARLDEIHVTFQGTDASYAR